MNLRKADEIFNSFQNLGHQCYVKSIPICGHNNKSHLSTNKLEAFK